MELKEKLRTIVQDGLAADIEVAPRVKAIVDLVEAGYISKEEHEKIAQLANGYKKEYGDLQTISLYQQGKIERLAANSIPKDRVREIFRDLRRKSLPKGQEPFTFYQISIAIFNDIERELLGES